MTIDEAIAKYKEITNTDANCPAHCNISCDNCTKESRQLVEWLEELKDYRDKNKLVVRVNAENMDSIKDKINELSKYAESLYNKAIDDFVEKIELKYLGVHPDDLYERYYPREICKQVKELAEHLKAGD